MWVGGEELGWLGGWCKGAGVFVGRLTCWFGLGLKIVV